VENNSMRGGEGLAKDLGKQLMEEEVDLVTEDEG